MYSVGSNPRKWNQQNSLQQRLPYRRRVGILDLAVNAGSE